mgnify:CR=1 FL=1
MRLKAGIQVIFDKYDLHLGDKSPHFMETSINKCDFILAIVTEKYIEKTKRGKVIPVCVKTDYSSTPLCVRLTIAKTANQLDRFVGFEALLSFVFIEVAILIFSQARLQLLSG